MEILKIIIPILTVIGGLVALIINFKKTIEWFKSKPKAKPKLGLKDLKVDYEKYPIGGEYLDVKTGPSIPRRLHGMQDVILRFTIEGKSPAPFRINKIFIDNLKSKECIRTTFPYLGEGAPGPIAIHGYSELNPEKSKCEIITDRQSELRDDNNYDSYNITLYSNPGFSYTGNLKINWVDLNDFETKGEFVFEDNFKIDFPKTVNYENYLQNAKEVKILYYYMIIFFIDNLERDDIDLSNYKFAVAGGSGGFFNPDSEWEVYQGKSKLDFRIFSKEASADFISLLGGYHGRPANFIIVDNSKLILQDSKSPDFGKLIQDPKQVQEVNNMFDKYYNIEKKPIVSD